MKLFLGLILFIFLAQCGNIMSIENVSKEPIRKSPFDKSKKKVKTNCVTKFIESIRKNNLQEVVVLINEGCDVNETIVSGRNYYAGDKTYMSPLHISLMNPDTEIMKLLLNQGADPNIELGITNPLELAAQLHKNEALKLLVSHEADVNHFNLYTEFQSPIISAISSGNLEGLKILVENGGALSINLGNGKKNIHDPLHIAVTNKRYEVAKYLLENGVSARSKTTPRNFEEMGDCVPCPYGIEAIHQAAQIEDASMSKKFINLLLAFDADVNAKNEKGLTALSYISKQGNYSIAEHLIMKGALVEDKAVVDAASYQNIEYLEVLLKKGGNPNAATDEYDSALLAALTCCGDGFNETALALRKNAIEMLLKHGAKPSPKLIKKVRSEARFNALLDLF